MDRRRRAAREAFRRRLLAEVEAGDRFALARLVLFEAAVSILVRDESK